ncbi:MAG: hypothetical protein ACFFA7_01580 [Promethearchaeota archaeon]
MKSVYNKISLSSGMIGIISLFTPVIFHISPNYMYNFWFWGLTLFFGLNSSEIGFTFDLELEFLIPGIISSIFIFVSCFLIFFILLKEKRQQQLKLMYYYIGGIFMIATPLFLIIGLQVIYIVVRGYPTFWGINYYWPYVAIYLQFIAGILYLLSLKKIRIRRTKSIKN